MASPSQPQGDYEELSQLAARISQHLLKNPKDAAARRDLHYVVSQMQGPQGATAVANAQDSPAAPEANPGMKIGAGLMQAGLDIPRGVATVVNPLNWPRIAGQLSGVNQWGNVKTAFQDPEANWAEKLDAILRAVPGVNIGYDTERNLLNATGAKSDEPASLTDQAHAAGNVASLALLGVNRNTPGVQAAGRVIGKIPFVGPLLRRPAGAPPNVAPVEGLLPTGADIGKSAQVDLTPSIRPAPDPLNIPTYLRRQAPATAPAPVPPPVPTLLEPPPDALPNGQPVAEVRAALQKQKFGTPAQIEETINRLRSPRPMPDIGTGKTLPYYPRGGRVEQALGQPPPVSAPTGPSPAALAQFKILMQMPESELAQVEGMFPASAIRQIRAFRAQQGLLAP